MAEASSSDGGVKNNIFWDLKRLFLRRPEEVELSRVVGGFENLGLQSNQVGEVSGIGRAFRSSEDDRSGREIIMQYPIRPDAEDCSYYMRTGTCKFGRLCKFNHPVSVRNLESTVKSTLRPCQFHLAGVCRFGELCRFDHSKSEAETSPLQYNIYGLPIRPGEEECSFYMRNGRCAYGAGCKFHHPDPESVELLEGTSDIIYGGYAFHLTDAAKAYFSLPSITDDNFQYENYIRNASKIPKRTEEMKPSFAPQAENATMVDDVPQGPLKREPCVLNDLGLPLRPGKEACRNYRNLGLCKLGRACPFDHPQKLTFTVPDGCTSEPPLNG